MTLRRDPDRFLPIDLGRIFVLSFVLINLITLNASSLPEIPDPGVTVTPGSICCGDCITVTIPVKNLRSVTFHGRIEIYVIDAKGYSNRQNSLSITLSPKEKRSFQTVVCPREPCNSFGTYKVTAKVVEDNGKVHDTDSAYFTVRDCGPSCDPPPGWTQTYRCNGNVLERLYVNDDCRGEWKTWKDCTPGECKYGLCVPKDDEPDPGNGGGTCNQWECQNRNKPIGEPYLKNSILYQRYQECNCIDGKCKCERVEKEVPCEGTVSGHVYDAETRRPINGAEVSCHGGQYPCYPNTDSGGFYRSCSCFCPSTNCDITCTARGYKSSTRTEITDSYGNKEGVDFYLQPEISEVKFRGEILRGGEDEITQTISFYEFVVKITEILKDDSGSLNVGDRVGVSSHRDGKARVDIAYNGDTVEVFGVNMGWDDSWWYGSTTDAHIALSESPWDGEGYYLTLTVKRNRPPKLISLAPDKRPPQKAGSRITWTANAEDTDGDPIKYKFEHKGPSTGGVYRTVKDWSTDNTWTWDADSDDVGENEVKVSIRDGKHKDVDDSVSARYAVESQDYDPYIYIPANAPETIIASKGTTLSYAIKVKNMGAKRDTIKLRTDLNNPESFDLSLSDNIVALESYESKLVYLNANVKEEQPNEITIIATSEGDPQKSNVVKLKYNPTYIQNPLLFSIYLRYDDNKNNEMNVIVPGYIKLIRDDSPFFDMAYDPTSTQTNIKEFEITIVDTSLGESIKIPIKLDPNWDIIATDFDISKHGYNFPNGGWFTLGEDTNVGGHCYGMSKTSVLYFNYGQNPQIIPNEMPPENENAYNLEKTQAMPKILEYDLSQLKTGMLTKKLVELSISKSSKDNQYLYLKHEISEGRPAVISIGSFLDFHAVVAYKLVETNDNNYIIVYDSNRPFVGFNKAAFSAITYDKKGTFTYGDKLDFFVVESLSELWKWIEFSPISVP